MADALTTGEIGMLASARGGAKSGTRWFGSARLVVCVVVLVAAAASMKWLESMGRVIFKKDALPLKRPLTQFDRARLAPQYVPHAEVVRPLSDETVQTLGTREYLNLILSDTTRPAGDRTAAAHVFITYYTGQPDMVPHVPDECWLAGGYERVGAWDETVTAAGCRAPADRVPVRLMQFRAPHRLGGAGRDFVVMYFFHCNGAYATTRDQVRLLQANLTDRFAYYAKFEIRFTDASLTQLAGREESIQALERLLPRLLPVVFEDHLPDWGAVRARGKGAAE